MSRLTDPGENGTEAPRHATAILTRVVSFLLSVTFSCGLVIAVAHVLNRPFVAPVYDVVLNLIAFASAVGASLLLGHRAPALLSASAILCWLLLARRTCLARRSASDSRLSGGVGK